MTEDQFVRLCQENPDLRIELTTQGELVIMPPTGLEPGRRNIRLARRLDTWTEAEGSGIAFDSSTLFTLPNGAKRSPDASWVRRERWEALSPEQRRGFGLLCPDFVVELRSPSDRLVDLQEKMQEYIANGASLITGWGEGLQSLPSDAYAAAAGRRILPLPTPQCDDDRLRRATRECLLAIMAVDQALHHSPLLAHDLAGVYSACWGAVMTRPHRYPALSQLHHRLLDQTFASAAISPGDVGVAYLSGSGDPQHDTAELTLVAEAFGPRAHS